ncbi:anthranilate phosphoribosyltransferase [Henriciella mobilis]|uniref:anthranilate phosphoribosyltransferase n=1 Tax=Henriciella mobilis TaxID=2305467 RepID=UPI000E65EEF9|nr:anthranilate phosphoribosyltransferase [Henriciella mobilis]RIJ15441.1 anthranilate phosphoribosyltransferase [Henriciella mobilis]RIJ18905.1 anthranilate phosphoribosyltransferase [Henriciella mobilis]
MTDTALSTSIKALARSEELPQEQLVSAFDTLLSGEAQPEQVGAFLMGLAVRGETSNELLAGAKVMREHARTISIEGPLLDTCGTGGLPWTSLNTSTASAIVIAAAGGRVAKHGNRSVPPKTGSADVLEALGVELDITPRVFAHCVEQAGVGFLFARSHHSAMRHVAPIRASLGIRTIFNLLGPLSNPANASHQILGVYEARWLKPMAETLLKLGIKRAWVVHGLDGIDELSISGPSRVIEVKDGTLAEFELTPADAGLDSSPLSALEGGTPDQNSAAIRELLEGRAGPFRDVVLLNAGAGLHILGLTDTLPEGVERARQAIDSGKAIKTLSLLADLSHGRS